jgi:predicted permease
MRLWRTLAVHVRALVRRRAADAELTEEIRYHLERDVERRIARGESEAEAWTSARREFGNVTVLAEEARAAARVEAVEQVLQDARYAVRGIRRAPRFALTVILTIGLGLGLVTSAFTIFDAYVLRLLAVRDPRSLFELQLHDKWGRERNASWNEYQALTRANPAFSESFASVWIIARRDGEPVMLQAVTGGFFSMLGVSPALGRLLEPSDVAAPGTGPVLVLSHRAWLAKFGGDSGVVGKTLTLRDRSYEVVGVAREGFDGLGETPPDFWVPITMAAALDDRAAVSGADDPMLKIVGRLVPGITAASAARALSAWASAATADRPERERAATVTLESRATPLYMSPATMMQVSPLFMAFALVLFIACANVANMMLARGMARQRELGIRLALGAGRGRLVRQLMTEALVLVVPAAVVGFGLSRLALDVAVKLMFATVPDAFSAYLRVLPLGPDIRLFAFLVGCAVLAAVGFGLAPALQTTRTSVVSATRGEFSAAVRPTRLRNALVIAQVTVCALLLVTGTVLLRGAQRLQSLDLGFRSAGVVQVYPPAALRAQVIERLRSDPTVRALEASSHGPLDGRFPQAVVTGVTGAASGAPPAASNARVTPGYFDALGIPLRRGRTFSADEARGGERVAVVSESTARQLWPGGNAIGQSLSLSSPYAGQARQRTVRVIGVVGDAVAGFYGERRDHPTVYESGSVDRELATLIVATSSNGPASAGAIRRRLAPIDPGGSVEIHTLEESAAVQLYPFRAAHWVASALGAIALLLTVTGIYGVLAFVVALREKEIGIRLALGATRRGIVGLVVRQSVRLAVIGVVAGAMLALGASRFIASRLTMIPAFDVVALVAGIGVVLAAALAAAYGPSRKAANLDPVETLRS